MNLKQAEILERAIKTRNFGNYESAIFQLAFLDHPCQKFVQGIFYLENGNTSRALNLLENYDTDSSKYYQALCYKKQREYYKAIECLEKIIEENLKNGDIQNMAEDNYVANIKNNLQIKNKDQRKDKKKSDVKQIFADELSKTLKPIMKKEKITITNDNVKYQNDAQKFFHDNVKRLEIKTIKNEDRNISDKDPFVLSQFMLTDYSLVLNFLGECYLMEKNRIKAVECYSKAFEIFPHITTYDFLNLESLFQYNMSDPIQKDSKSQDLQFNCKISPDKTDYDINNNYSYEKSSETIEIESINSLLPAHNNFLHESIVSDYSNDFVNKKNVEYSYKPENPSLKNTTSNSNTKSENYGESATKKENISIKSELFNSVKNKNNFCYEYYRDSELLYKYIETENFTDLKKFLHYLKSKINSYGPWLFADAGKYLVDIYKYKDAIDVFDYITKKCIGFLRNIDFYSTILWHNKDVSKLGILGIKMARLHPNDYRTWTVLGNYFSLKQKIDRAILCFMRSTIIKPNFYAYALIGHEYTAKQEYQNAIKSFQKSLSFHQQNFNAFFGMGAVYMHQKMYKISYKYMESALKINPCNPMLRLLIVKNLNHMKDYENSLKIICDTFDLVETSIENFPSMLKNKQINYTQSNILLELTDIYINKGLCKSAHDLLSIIKIKDNAYFLKEKLLLKEAQISNNI